MKKVLILTRTNWSEPPRIRHQITRLLKENGYSITYVEKNTYRSIFIKKRYEEDITFYSHSELLHHQLRYFRFIQWCNNWVVKFYLKKIIKKTSFDFVMNFCYEYSFLKELVGDKKVITMIEDDFEAMAKFGMSKAIDYQMKCTCQNSDDVLTVSYPLYDKLTLFKDNVTMFFPWSQHKYKKPTPNLKRNTVLYFGYVGRIDWDIVVSLVTSTEYHYQFYGPPIRNTDLEMINRLKKEDNFEYFGYSNIEDLVVDDVFCSLLPYDLTLKSIKQSTISNRAFNLLALGLPLVFAGIEYLIKAPQTVISSNKTLSDYKYNLKYFFENFDNVQDDIKSYISDHYKENRMNILSNLLKK